MLPRPVVVAFVAACPLASLMAQTLTFSAPVPTVATIQAASTQQATLNPGPMAASGAVVAGTSAAEPYAAFRWISESAPSHLSFEATAAGWNNVAGGQLSVTPGEVLLQLSAPTTMPVFLSMTRIVGQPANAPAPTTFVDVRDDGIPELTESSPVAVPSSMALTIGPVATPIRLRVAASHAGVGNSEVRVKLVVTPSVGITTNTWTAGCGAYYDVKPTFQDELQIVGVTNSNEVTVAVLGLGFKPVFLGVPYQIPCFAFPSPDLLLLCPPSGALTLPVPAAIRPLQLWTQGVSVSQSLLASSDVFRVNAL